MKNASERYGAAELGDKLFATRVEHDGVRPKVTSLLTSDDSPDSESLGSGRLFFGVDTRLAVVKKIQVKKYSSIEAAEIARFEMAHSLLEEADNYYFDTLPLENGNGFRRFMSIAYHRREIDRMIESYSENLRKPSGFKLNAVALASGFSAFCRIDPGELQVLADFGPDIVLMAVLHRDKLYSVNYLEIEPSREISSGAARKLAAEFKLTLSYHLAELFQDGITVPLSRIILSGLHARNELLTAALNDQFPAEITLPQFNGGYFQLDSEIDQPYPLEQFLIPLGLAVE